MSDAARSILFALCLCLVCGTLLTAASSGLKERQGKNIRIDQQKNILKTVGLVDVKKKYSPEEIEKIYTENITKLDVDSAGQGLPGSIDDRSPQKLPLYLFKKNGNIHAYILPVNTKGLWGKIFGYLALKDDGVTISGFTVCRHSETPGLGGEIEQRWFQKNFAGKKITDMGGDFVSVSVAKGKADASVPAEKRINYVDGISGATLTGTYLSKGLKDTLYEYEPVSLTFRNKKKYCKANKNLPWCRYEPEKE